MEKIYKNRIYRIIFNLLCGAALSFFVFYIAQIWLTQLTSIIIATIIFFSYIWLVICGNFITIIVNDKELIVKNGKKEGIGREYSEIGKIIKEVLYKDDEEVKKIK